MIKLAEKDNYILNNELAAYKKVPNEVIDILITADKQSYSSALLANDKAELPAEFYERCAASESWRLRQDVAACPRTPVSALKKLMNDQYSWIVDEVGNNPNATFEMVEEIAKDRSGYHPQTRQRYQEMHKERVAFSQSRNLESQIAVARDDYMSDAHETEYEEEFSR